MQLTDNECLEKSNIIIKYIDENLSFKAVDLSTNQIIGIVINRLEKRKDITINNNVSHLFAHNASSNKVNAIHDFGKYINSKFQLFNHYPNIDIAIDLRILSVNPNYQHIGIGGNLMLHTINYVQMEKISSVIYALCSNQYTCKLCEKFNFEKLFEINFNEYVVNGNCPLMPDEPNTVGRIYAKIL